MEDSAALPDFRRINNANLRVIAVFKSFQGAAETPFNRVFQARP